MTTHPPRIDTTASQWGLVYALALIAAGAFVLRIAGVI